MDTNTTNNQEDQEIDLSIISKKIGGFFEGISTSIFRGILFLKKNIFIISVLFIIGGALGYFLDYETKIYDNDIIVMPNFGSVDYLYSKIDLLESKIKNGDTVFLKNIGINNSKDINLIEINPIIDIYSFVNNAADKSASNAQNSQNFELVKLLSEDGDIKKVIKDNLTSKNYTHHTIHIVTNEFVNSKKTIEPILNYLNNSEYYQALKKVCVDNINMKMSKNEGIIIQIDGLLNQFSLTTSNNQKSDKLVYYNENTQLNEVIQTKNNLISEIGYQKLQLVSVDKIIKEISNTINIKNTKGVNSKLKFILPLLFVFGFIIVSWFRSFYKKQAAKFLLK